METSSVTEKTKALLRKYLAGACTPQERQLVEQWYESFDQEALPAAHEEARSLAKISHSLQGQVSKNVNHRRILHLFQRVYSTAAILLLILGGAAVLYDTVPGNSGPKPRTFSTGWGERKSIQLPDGSVVFLNAGSSLQFQKGFGTSSRKVTLKGEAFFAVKSDPRKPFIVQTGTLRTHVLGTSFNVRAYPDDETASVTVTEGKVRVDNTNIQGPHHFTHTLLPGKKLVYEKYSAAIDTLDEEISRIGSWRTGVLYFENESINAIAKVLERHYNRVIMVEGGKSRDCRYTVHFSNQPVETVMNVLSHLTGAGYKVRSDSLFIDARSCR